MRAPTLAQHCRTLAAFTDTLIDAVRSRDMDVIEAARDEVHRLLPPHGFDPMDALLVVLLAQIDRSVPVEERLAWVLGDVETDVDPAVVVELPKTREAA